MSNSSSPSPRATDASAPKVLRIGVIQGVNVIEERLIRQRAPVSFGVKPGNTFVLAGSDLPASTTVFEVKGDGYQLVFQKDNVGQLERDGATQKLQELRETAEKVGDRYRVAINDDTRGRIRISSEITVFFHFVPAPPAGAVATLPREIRGGVLQSVERIFTAALVGSLLVHAILGVIVNVVEPAKQPDDLRDLRRLVENMVPPRVEAQKVKLKPEAPTGGTGTKTTEKPTPSAGPADSGGGTGGGDDKKSGGPGSGGVGDRTALRQQLAGRGILQLIGGRSGGSGGGAVGSVFGAGSSISDDIGTALQGTAGVGIAGTGGGDGVTRRGTGGGGVGGGGFGGEGGGAVGIGELKTGGGGPVDTGNKEAVRVVARVKADDVEAVDGTVDKKGVAATIRRRQDAFQSCYENALKANSKLQGKLVVEFTIGDGGKVTDATVVKDGLGSADVATCVVSTLKRIRFPAPTDGDVTISNSFVFQPGG